MKTEKRHWVAGENAGKEGSGQHSQGRCQTESPALEEGGREGTVNLILRTHTGKSAGLTLY